MIRQELRRSRGERKQEEVARAVGINQQHLSKIERGMICPNARIIWRLAEYYAKPVWELFPDVFVTKGAKRVSEHKK